MKPEVKEALEKARAALKAHKAQAAAQAGNTETKFAPGSKNKLPSGIQKALGKWGVKSFDDLMKVNTGDKKFSYLPKDERDRVKSIKEMVDVCVIMSGLKFQDGHGNEYQKSVAELDYFKNEVELQIKAFGINSGDEGYEWIPTMVSEQYLDEYNLDRKVSGLFAEIRMPSNPFKWPVLTGGAIARKVAEVAKVTPSQKFQTDKTIMLDAVKLSAQYELPEELTEDSAPDIIKVIRQEVIEGQEKAIEIAILEGDTAGSMHYYSQLPDVTPGTLISAVTDSPELVFDGLRKRVIAAGANAFADAGGVAVTETKLSQARGKMGKFGVDPSALVWITSPKSYLQMLDLDDVRTMEQYGAQATVLTGELAKYEGCPVICSEYLRQDTSSDGKNKNGGSNDRLTVLIVNRKRWFVGSRRAIQVLVEKNRTQYDVLDMVSFSRKAFQGVLKADGSNYATESSVAAVFNIGA